jgi:hypothetical protein
MGNRRVLLLMTASILLMYGTPVQGQFVTLEGKDFKLDGEDFYVLAMNYSVLLARNDDVNGVPAPEDIYFAPDASFGPTSAFDCTGESDCQARLLTDFQKVREMGFNTLRVVGGFGAHYRDTPEHGPDERRFGMFLHRNPFPNNNHDHDHIHVDLEADMDGPYSERFFDLLIDLLDVAEQADLKVILLCVEPTKMNENENRRHMYPTFDQKAVDEYTVYLSQMAAALQHHPALLAYDLFNEPQFNTLEYQGAVDEEEPQSHPKWKKQDICDFTAQWYDAIKGQDPNHLITLGGLGDYELEVWDMAVLHIDFYSLHFYPLKNYLSEWDMEQALEHYQAVLHWFGQTCPMPWIIGETAFSASDATSPPHTGPASPPEVYQQYHQWPYMEGTEEDQRAFAEWSLALTRQCGGSGWSWWYFQEYLWWDYYLPMGHPDGPAYSHEGLMRGIYYAMLHPGDSNADWYEKPAVDEVRNYVPAPMPEYPGAQPANYYNWNNLPGPVSYTGTIKDQHGHPIKNAQAWLRLNNPDDPDVPPHYLPGQTENLTFHVAVTNPAGVFQFNTQPQITGFHTPVYYNLILVAVGASVEAHGGWFDGLEPPSGTTFYLDRTTFQFDDRLEDMTVASTDGVPLQRYAAWVDLEMEDVTVTDAPDPGATQVEFAARHTVHIVGGFHAQQGSEVHIYLEETFPDCTEDSFKSLVVGGGEGSPEEAVAAKERTHKRIELSFLAPEGVAHRVRPNPFTNHLEVSWGSEDLALLQLLDATGRTVGTWQRPGPVTLLELGTIAPGPYYLHITQGAHISTHQIIKQP